MPETARGLYYPAETGHIPDVPADMKLQAESVEELITASKGQLLVAQNTGAALFKAMSGDISINESGVTQIGSGKVLTGNLAEGAVTRAKLAAEAKPVTWYASSIIDTAEEIKTSPLAYTLMPTPDEIKSVTVPTGGKLIVNFKARLRCSISGAASNAKAGIFIGTNQLTSPGGSNGNVVEVPTINSEVWHPIVTSPASLSGMVVYGSGATGTDVITGQVISPGALEIYIPAGTYNISVKVKNEPGGSGIISMRERKLYAEVHGF